MTTSEDTPTCFGCKKTPAEIDEYVQGARDESDGATDWAGKPIEIDPDDFVRLNEGTYNEQSGHFMCTSCYIKAGMPSAPGGWKAP